MAKTGFFKTVKAFSCAAALAAGLFASAAFSSCSNLEGDDFSPAPQAAPAGTAPGGESVPASLKMGSVSGTIQQKEEQPTVARSVVPTVADVTGGIISYTVSAWGTKADGTVVPESSPITVDTTTTTFSLGLEYGTWTLRADAKDTSSNIIMTQTTAQPITLDDSNPVVNLNFALDYAQISGTPGALSLTMAYATSVSKISYSLLKSDGTSVASGVVNPAPASSFTLNASQDSALGSLEPGDYQLVVEFLAADSSVLMRMDQAVQIYSNITTNKIDGVAPYINSGAVNVSADVIKKYQQSVVYVGGTGIGSGTAASDSNNGTQFDPVEHVERALEIIEASMLTSSDVPDGFKVFVQADTSLTGNLALSSSKKISIVGTNTSAYYKIDGALTNGITASASDVSFSYINIDKVKGFEVAGGQTNLTNCKITNGQIKDGAAGGAGLCVNGAGAKAILTNCSISGCSTDEFGGGIYVNDDSSTTTAQVELTNCVIGADSGSCATASAYSNYAYRGGGGINIGGYGKAILKDTKVFCGSTGGNASGGGIRCYGGTLEITGGQINHNYAGSGGGGIWSDGTVTINGCTVGELSANAAPTGNDDCGNYTNLTGGGGIFIEGGTLETTSGFSVIKNYSVIKGGGIYTIVDITLKDVLVSCNAAAQNGGGIYVNGSSSTATAHLVLNNCTIGAESSEAAQPDATKHSNSAKNGGGVYVEEDGSVSFSGTNTISYNYAAVQGGGIYAGADADFNGCKILRNLGRDGGGIYATGGNFSMTDSEVSNNNANDELGSFKAGMGGGVFFKADGKTFTMNSGKICENSAFCVTDPTTANGGGVYVEKGKFQMEAGEISSNSAANNGGGLIIEYSGDLIINDGKISGNSAGVGGGICSFVGATQSVVINGGEISQNHASSTVDGISQGDGIYSKHYQLKITGGKICDNDETGIYCEGGYSYVEMTGGQVSGHTGYGFYFCENSDNKLDFSGGKVSGNGIGIHIANSGVEKGLIMSAGAKFEDNCVFLAKQSGGDLTYLYVNEGLTSTELPVATIWPGEYGPGKKVIEFASAALATSQCSKFAVKDDEDGESWAIAASGTSGVLKSSTIYVDGNATEEGSGTKTSPCKTLYNALTKVTAPNTTIIVKNGTTETADLTTPAGCPGLTIKSADATQKKITGTSSINIHIEAAATVSNIAFSNWGCVYVASSVMPVELENVAITDCSDCGLWLGGGAMVSAQNLTVKDCSVTGASGGGIFVNGGANLSVDGLVMQGCHANGTNCDGGGIANSGTVSLRQAKITDCTAGRHGAGIFNDNGATLILNNDCDIPSGIYLTGGNSAYPANPVYVKPYFELAGGADKIPLSVEERTGAGNQFKDGDAVVQGYDTYSITEDQVNCFVTSGTALGLEYDGTASPHCGKLIDKSIAGGIKINVGGNITFEVATPSSSGEKARFNVLDNSSGTPTYVTPTSAQIKILQYGSAIYSADAQEVTATYLAEGQYELYCKAVIGGVAYDTTVPFAAGGKYTPLTLEAEGASTTVTFDNKAAGPVTYRVNGGTEQTIAAGTTETITLNNAGDYVSFYGDNAKYATSTADGNYSNIACNKNCYVYGNIMSLVKSDGFETETALTDNYAFCKLFTGNANIKNKTGADLVLPATTLTDYCYYSMFNGCKGLTSAPALPATTLAAYCYGSMFKVCINLVSAPELNATVLADYCYASMFSGCSNLETAPNLPATTLKQFCCAWMFESCSKLAVAPALPATNLDSECYRAMFKGCKNLTAAPALPATTLVDNCYQEMFSACSSLASAPELPATTLADWCYNLMFSGCSSLTTPPELPVTNLKQHCYGSMFYSCKNLAVAPELPATNLKRYCYDSMFYGCTSLTSAPDLPAATLEGYCYREMFKGCSSLNSVTCLATDISATDCTTDWLSSVAATGTFTQAPGVAWPTGANGIPAGWTVNGGGSGGAVTNATPLTIEADVAGATVTFSNKASDSVTYKMSDGTEGTIASGASKAITLSAGDTVQFFGDNTTYGTSGSANCSNISCSANCYIYGNIMSLVRSSGYESATTLTGSYTFAYLFNENANIKNKDGCDLFLPATTLADNCYMGMFFKCTGLTAAPALPATSLTTSCYNSMFYGCTSLKSVTCLATNISVTGCTNNWLNNVATGGTFYRASGVAWPSGGSGVPGSWSVVEAP